MRLLYSGFLIVLLLFFLSKYSINLLLDFFNLIKSVFLIIISSL